MKRYVKAVLGGFLAILAALGWMFALGAILASRGIDFAVAVTTPKRVVPVILILIFSAGFFLAFRAAYSRNSN